ncbi:hypothetical protein A3H80_02380 [Candidatus Roizmanbacteria bacterium RIFCSPLOWO2_02_FULL_37_19]|uniref:Uncharacterized protein n=1 Tax=Candidatus Roizmanbacteria bacterium RIFCSPHIGHO2_02_FULL_37_24 TaxID=1802037 RepID=A0A1F7H1A8_9BACT|nr:MAG: hypothetical protein A2862_03000 [Candidatus Roizmanbacteria bacterium RIFCSPHIGHO2_01_FULL_38_41]OGK24714.1 MAG: hypothetical protein A3C24_01160 [Candidatus Roizmanbacteria bacterium RIFCSPHIGHO2_02_FULL_37_24]OGK32890.1 MAG: hypothetical protein A3E10_02905 [Candidatus Roizmanbacteria bacterium RIFCSPHIGHO2_12_FULL_37_23]OGK44105.1 MAG: hypothetical protein A2956_03585 [Candidatus Roizmanbacteria bacterium RIFCSPLOWO2_01_FULL_37_57]OGK54388.1 MAG: hypothetical protein A3H80_02380 [Ca
MRPLRRPDDETRDSLLAQILGVDFDPTREYTPGEIIQMGVDAARHMVQGLFENPHTGLEDPKLDTEIPDEQPISTSEGGDPENDV